jgi:hypothetical protein
MKPRPDVIEVITVEIRAPFFSINHYLNGSIGFLLMANQDLAVVQLLSGQLAGHVLGFKPSHIRVTDHWRADVPA